MNAKAVTYSPGAARAVKTLMSYGVISDTNEHEVVPELAEIIDRETKGWLLLDVLERLIAELPSNRDWLDPTLEAQAKAAIRSAKGEL